MNTMKLAAASTAALLLSLSAANAELIFRQDETGNRVVVNTDTEVEVQALDAGPEGDRPANCVAGAYWTRMDGEREIFTSCDDENTRYMRTVTTTGSVAGGPSTDRPTERMDQALEPFAPDTGGNR